MKHWIGIACILALAAGVGAWVYMEKCAAPQTISIEEHRQTVAELQAIIDTDRDTIQRHQEVHEIHERVLAKLYVKLAERDAALAKVVAVKVTPTVINTDMKMREVARRHGISYVEVVR